MSGYTRPAPTIGSKYVEGVDVADIAKAIRADIKAFKANGVLPDDLKVSVTISRFAGGRSIDVKVKNFAEAFGEPARPDPNTWVLSHTAETVHTILNTTMMAYNRDDSDTMVDYYRTNFYGWVSIEGR